ncbi:MAG: SDR family oxidoreductase [bacterium]|nr:SDR family oxidoreductase [bacterium]
MKRKTILLVGIGGLGRTIYKILGDLNFGNVFVIYKQNSEAADTFLEKCKSLGLETKKFQADVTELNEVKSAVETCIQTFQQLDAVVALQGDFLQKEPLSYQPQEIELMFATNFYANYYLSQVTLPFLRQTQGTLIFFGVAHNEQFHSQIHTLPYSASKSALVILMRTLARSEAKFGVRVNMISPGIFTYEENDLFTEQIPLQRKGTPDDLLGALRFLLSNESHYCTGTNLILSGGWAI